MYEKNPIWDDDFAQHLADKCKCTTDYVKEWYLQMVQFDAKLYTAVELNHLNENQIMMLQTYFEKYKFDLDFPARNVAYDCGMSLEQIQDYFTRARNQIKLKNWRKRWNALHEPEIENLLIEEYDKDPNFDHNRI